MMIPWIAMTVGLRRGSIVALHRKSVSAPLEVADRAAATVENNSDLALEALMDAGMDMPAANGFFDVPKSLRCSWRVTALVPDGVEATTDLATSSSPARASLRSIAILDAGAQGLWQRVSPEEPIGSEPPDPTTPVTLRPLSHGEAWNAITDLLDVAAK